MTDNIEMNDAEAALAKRHSNTCDKSTGRTRRRPSRNRQKTPKRPTMSRTQTRKTQRKSPKIAQSRDARRPRTVPSNVSSITIRESRRASS